MEAGGLTSAFSHLHMSTFFRIFVTMNEDYIDTRRTTEGSLHQSVSNDLIIRRSPLKKQAEFKKRVKVSKASYTFLQFHHLIWKWATENHKLKGREINLLLYLQPLVTFNNREFRQAMKEMSSTDAGTLTRLKKGGWLNIWSQSGKTTHYALTVKANTLLNRMYNMFLAEEEIPMSPRRNIIVRKESKNEDLMGLFKKFNQKVRENSKNDRT